MQAKTLIVGIGAAALAGVFGCGGSRPASEPPPTSTGAASLDPAASPEDETHSEPAETATETAATEAEPEKPDVPPQNSSLDRVMRAHFSDALLIRAAVIQGRYENAADPAYVIASLENLDDLPAGWQPFVEQMQQTAKRINNSTTASAAAAGAADLGVSCGLCHQQHGGPKPSTDPRPAPGTTIETRMKQHVWASERLWEGLAVPSAEAWNEGAKVLSTDPFPKEVLDRGSVDARSAAADFSKLVSKAAAKKTIQDRAALYAELLVTCGQCHVAVKQQ